MNSINDLDIWQLIPPEEKLEMMAKSHARGMLNAAICVIIAGTCAVGLQIPWILWSALLCSPFVFQFTSNKAWRSFKPSAVLRYLAARSAARRYAFTTRATDLDCSLMFRGVLSRVYSNDEAMQAMTKVLARAEQTEVWVALFRDAIVLMSEYPGGAKLELGHLINDKLTVEGTSSSGEEYASDRELYISYPQESTIDALVDLPAENMEYKLTSKYPAALVVFEKKIDENRKKVKESAAMIAAAAALDVQNSAEDDSFFS